MKQQRRWKQSSKGGGNKAAKEVETKQQRRWK